MWSEVGAHKGPITAVGLSEYWGVVVTGDATGELNAWHVEVCARAVLQSAARTCVISRQTCAYLLWHGMISNCWKVSLAH